MPKGVTHVTTHTAGKCVYQWMPTAAERNCERLAEHQQGVFHRDQAIEAGVGRRVIERRTRAGLWVRLLPGVYCLKGTRLTWQVWLMAACLWAQGVVSHRSAGLLWQLDGIDGESIEVTTILRRRAPRGILVHQVDNLSKLACIRYRGFVVTDPTQTLIDLAGVLDPLDLEAALDSALRRRRTYPNLLLGRLDALGTRGRRGVKHLRELARERAQGGRPTESPLEVEAKHFLNRFGFDPPARQHRVRNARGEHRRLDFAWPELKVGIEVDSREWHDDFSALEGDVARSNFYLDLDWKVLRLTRRGMRRQGPSLARQLQGLLGHRELGLGGP